MILFDWTKSIVILINFQKRNILSNFFYLKKYISKTSDLSNDVTVMIVFNI